MREKVKALSLVAKAVLVLVCLVLIIPSVIRLYPFLVGADGSYIVLGGSMKPTLSPGDLAFTEKVETVEVEVGDIVAVKAEFGIYTHRVVEKVESDEGILFRLKGDANEDPDSSYVNGSEIIGKTSFSLPMGYLYTKSGYVLIVATPLMLLAVAQAVKIYKVYDTRKRRRGGLKAILLGKGGRRRRKISILDASSTLLLIILVAGGTYMMAPYFISGGGSFFTDTESSSSNVIRAGTWKVVVAADVNLDPGTLNLESQGQWVTGYATIETEYDENDIIVDTILLEGSIPAEWGEVQDAGWLMVKFDRQSVIDYLVGKEGDVTLTVTGMFVDGTYFEGSDTITVMEGE